MIPCNFPGRSEVEVGHWVLAIRERGGNGKHKLYVLDSLGHISGNKYRNEITSKLLKTPFFQNFPKGKAYNVPLQTECECGARTAKFMEDIVQNYSIQKIKNIPQIIVETIRWERENGTHETIECRAQVRDRLEGEKQNLIGK